MLSLSGQGPEYGAGIGLSQEFRQSTQLAKQVVAQVPGIGRGQVFGRVFDAAQRNLAEAGVGGSVDIRPGDALRTLAEVPEPIGLVFLDSWKDMCLPVLQLLEDRLAPGALVVADDVNQSSLSPYLAYVRDPANGYVSVIFPVEDGMEISCRV